MKFYIVILTVSLYNLLLGQSINKYRIFCITENKNVYSWADVVPTKCPNNSSDVINGNSISIVDQIVSNEVKIQSESVPTGGHFKSETFKIVANPGLNSVQKIWPFNISLLLASFTTTQDHTGDIITVEVPSDLTIGIITQNVAINDTIIHVNSAVISMLSIGFYLSLTDGVNTDELGCILAIDSTNNTVTMENPSTHNYLVQTPTAVNLTICPVYNFEFGAPQTYNLGQSSLGAFYIPANIPLVMKYLNTGQSSKTLIINYEFFY